MATILSFKEVADIPDVNIRYDFPNRRFIVSHPNRTDLIFSEWENGIYAMDTSKSNTPLTPPHTTCTSLLHTVARNKLVYTAKELQGAERARKIQDIIGWPGTATFHDYVRLNSFNNSPITNDDVHRAEHIFGPPLPLLQGQPRPHPRIHNVTRIPLPAEIASAHSKLQIFVDFFYVNGFPFLHTITDQVIFRTTDLRKSNYIESKERTTTI